MNGVRKSREASFRVCATRTTPGVTHRRRSYLEDLQNRGTCRAAAGHLHASCLRRQYVSSPPTSGFFLTCQHVWGPTSQGPRVPGSQGHRGTILPRSCRESVANGARPSPCDTWRPPRPRTRQRDTPPPPQRRAEGGAPGILAPCLSHPGTLSLASWQRPEQSGSVPGGPSRSIGGKPAPSRVAWLRVASSFPVLEGCQPVGLRP